MKANMENEESKGLYLKWWESHIGPQNSKWFRENLQEVDQSVKEVLNLIKQDGGSFVQKAETDDQKKVDLISHVEEFSRRYKLLAERYNNLTAELQKKIPSLLQIERPGISVPGSCLASPMLTPDQKLGLHKSDQAVNFNLFLSSGGGSSDSSLKEDSEYSSSASSDFDSDSSNYAGKKCSNSHMPGDKVLQDVFVELETELPGVKDKVHAAGQVDADNRSRLTEIGGHEMLLGKITKYDTELRILNKKIQFSEEEIARLKGELESVESKMKTRDADVEIQKRKVTELQKQVAVLESQVFNSSYQVVMLEQELESNRQKLADSEKEIMKLKQSIANELSQHTQQLQDLALLETELNSEKGKVLELQDKIFTYTSALSDRDNVIGDLNAALCDAQNGISVEKAELQSEISVLSERRTFLEAKNEELKLLCQSLENNIRQSETEKMEMKGWHEAQEISWQSEIRKVKDEVHEKSKLVEALNKNLDMLKVNHDMLMAEKDGVNAKVNTLSAEVSSRDDKIRQTQDHLHQLRLEHVELLATFEKAQKVTDELRSRVDELEKEVDRQKVLISDRAEEKREAIRQLCFSLEHYRNGYEELRQAYILKRRNAILAT